MFKQFLPSLSLFGKVVICVAGIYAIATVFPSVAQYIFNPLGTLKEKTGIGL